MALVAIKWLQFTHNYTLLVGEAFYDYKDAIMVDKNVRIDPDRTPVFNFCKKKDSVASTT